MEEITTPKFVIEKYSKKLLNAIPDLILVKGPESHILWANKAFREYYGMSNEKLHGLIDSPITRADHTLQYIKDDEHVFITGKTLDVASEPITRHDGTIRNFNTIKSAIRDEQGVVIMTIGISRDITERLHMEEETLQTLHELKKMNSFMTDREIRMSELKKEIKELKKTQQSA